VFLLLADKKQSWQQVPLPLPSVSIYALAAGRERLWVGGVGGMASRAITGTQEAQDAWQPGIAALPLSAVTALLAFDDVDVLLAGGSEGIACSFNCGRDWQSAKLEHGVAAIVALAASPNFASDQTALAATLSDGLLRTNDGGRSWVDASFGLESLEVSALIWAVDNTLLAATSDGVYRSRDAGRAWRRIYEDESDEQVAVEALAVLPDGTLFAALESGALLVSRDNGKQWLPASVDTQAQALSLHVTVTGALLFGMVDRLLRSDDAGASWQIVSEQSVVVCAQHGTQIYAGHTEGMSMSSDDGRTWRELASPPLSDLHIALTHADHLWLKSFYGGLFAVTPTTGWLWLEKVPMAPKIYKMLSDDVFFHSSSSGLVRQSLTDGTQQWLLAGSAGHSAHIAVRQVDERCHIWMVKADGTGIQHSPNGGASWRELSVPFGILPLVAFDAIGDRLLAATYDPRQYQVCLWYSSDEGQTWIRGIEAGTRWPLVATCAQPPAVSIGNILFLERAAGQWQRVTVGSDGGANRRVLGLQLGDKTLLFVLTTTGIQCSEDLGATWHQENEGLPVEHIVDLAIVRGALIVLLTGGRVWQRELLDAD
jgi:photosystem II stability/assembly factor-like uncharacterized protein